MARRPIWTTLALLAGCAAGPPRSFATVERPPAPASTSSATKASGLRSAPSPAGTPASPSLYARIGGTEAIRAVVPAFLENVAADARINYLFAMSDLPTLQVKLVEFFCSALGGPCTYTGRDMRTAHAQLPIASKHFDALVEDLGKALDHLRVPAREKGEILAALAPLRADIVH